MPSSAGPVGVWVAGTRSALRGESDADVPCGTCTACCRSGQFVHIAPDETAALARIPRDLLFPAPGLPPGHVLLGYDDRGRCPMLGESGCTIYADRPRTCRSYDCRVFAAAGTQPAGGPAGPVAEQVRRWRFDVRDADDRARLDAIRAAAAFLASGAERPADVDVPSTGLGLALMALAVHETFLDTDGPGPRVRQPDPREVWRAARATRRPG